MIDRLDNPMDNPMDIHSLRGDQREACPLVLAREPEIEGRVAIALVEHDVCLAIAVADVAACALPVDSGAAWLRRALGEAVGHGHSAA